jgi:hypothetical protein
VLHTYGDLADAQLVQTYGFVDIPPQLPQQQEQGEEPEQQQQLSANPHNYVLLPVQILLDCVKTVAAAAKIWPAKKTKQVGSRMQNIKSTPCPTRLFCRLDGCCTLVASHS